MSALAFAENVSNFSTLPFFCLLYVCCVGHVRRAWVTMRVIKRHSTRTRNTWGKAMCFHFMLLPPRLLLNTAHLDRRVSAHIAAAAAQHFGLMSVWSMCGRSIELWWKQMVSELISACLYSSGILWRCGDRLCSSYGRVNSILSHILRVWQDMFTSHSGLRDIPHTEPRWYNTTVERKSLEWRPCHGCVINRIRARRGACRWRKEMLSRMTQELHTCLCVFAQEGHMDVMSHTRSWQCNRWHI